MIKSARHDCFYGILVIDLLLKELPKRFVTRVVSLCFEEMRPTPYLFILACILCAGVLAAEEVSLVPENPSTAPDYFCTWNVQGFACSYSSASNQADMMIEANLFGSGLNQNWTGFYPEIRADLTFLLDDAFDFPIGGGHNDPRRGSIELDPARFPSYIGTPAERLANLSKDVKAKGWRDLGLWICNSRPNMDELPIDSDTYWGERLKWSQQAGIGQWKVDWGIGVPGKPLWKFKLTPKARAIAPDVWMECGQGDLYRTYDVAISVSIPETIRRIAAFLTKNDPNDRRIINCEDEVYIGAGTGSAYGIMRHPLRDPMPNGKPDEFFKPTFRDIKRRTDEVVRAVRWHRIAQPFPKDDKFLIDEVQLQDYKSKPAPARIARGGIPLPTVRMPDGREPPYVLCCKHPGGEIAVASIPRNLVNGNKTGLFFPLADVSIEVGNLDCPVGIFGDYSSITLVTKCNLIGKKFLAQDLAGNTPIDISSEVKVEPNKVTIHGSVIRRIGLMAAKPNDISDPGLVLAVKGHTIFREKKPMKPATSPLPNGAQSVLEAAIPEGRPDTKLAEGKPVKLRLKAGSVRLPNDGTETRLSISVLDSEGKPIANRVKGRLTITLGKGLFPTGQSFEFNTQNGQDSIEFRAYDLGKVTIKATSEGLIPDELEITVVPVSQK